MRSGTACKTGQKEPEHGGDWSTKSIDGAVITNLKKSTGDQHKPSCSRYPLGGFSNSSKSSSLRTILLYIISKLLGFVWVNFPGLQASQPVATSMYETGLNTLEGVEPSILSYVPTYSSDKYRFLRSPSAPTTLSNVSNVGCSPAAQKLHVVPRAIVASEYVPRSHRLQIPTFPTS